jgi:hypothetical protein
MHPIMLYIMREQPAKRLPDRAPVIVVPRHVFRRRVAEGLQRGVHLRLKPPYQFLDLGVLHVSPPS